MITREDSGFSVRVAKQREMAPRNQPPRSVAGRLLPLAGRLLPLAGRLLPLVLVVVAIEHGSYVSDPALSDQLVREGMEVGLALAVGQVVGRLGLQYYQAWLERPPAPALPPPPPPVLVPLTPPPASPVLAPASQPPLAVPGLAELLDLVEMGNTLEAATAWCKENAVNHVSQLETSQTACEKNGRNVVRRSGMGVQLVSALWPSLKILERDRLLGAIHIRHELAELLGSVELSDKLGSATAWCIENGVYYVAQLDEWGDIRAEFVEMLSLPLAKRGRLPEAIKAFSKSHVHREVRRLPVSKRDEDQFLRQVEGASANRQYSLRRIDRMFLPPTTPALHELLPVPPTPPLPGIAPAPPTQPLPGLAEVLDLLQMSEELETITAFCEEQGVTRVAQWAGPARIEGGLCVDKYTELREIISAQFE